MIKQLLLVSRPISWLNTAFPFAAGYLILFRHVDLVFIMGTLFFLIPYNLIMYGINDVFDYESDVRNPRKGGIEGALATKRLHWPIIVAALSSGLPFLLFLGWHGSWVSRLTLFVVMFFVLAYSVPKLRFKERPFLDSFTSSCHFTGPLVYALSLTHVHRGALPVVVAFFLWGMASHAFGAVQDVVPDREGGISSIATVMGAATTVRFAVVLYVLASLLLIVYGLPTALYGLIGLLYAVNTGAYVLVTDKTSSTVNVAWRRFIYLNFIAGFFATLLLIHLFTNHL